jgi:hypothetical protein
MNRVESVSLAITCCAALAACGDIVPPASPGSLSPTRSGPARSSVGRSTLFRNDVKYRDAGLKPATGRSGSASLTALALLGSDGVATLDVTSGGPDGSPSGTLALVQVKQFDPNGALQRTSVQRGTTGSSMQFTLPARVRGSRLQVQANVTGIDLHRTDVVTVTETVKLRPDLAVTRLDHLPQVVQNAQAMIFMTIRELNGDVGANANCVLEVDGQVVDQAMAVWADAGREVGCAFVHRFAELGTKTLTARVTDVSPADFNLANNSRSSTIVIVEPAPPATDNDFAWDGTFRSARNIRGSSSAEGWWQVLSTGERYDYRSSAVTESGNNMYSNIGGRTTRTLPGPINVTFKDQLDGTQLHDDQFNEVTDTRIFYNGGYFQQHCSMLERTVELTGERGPFTASMAWLATCAYTVPVTGVEVGTWFQYSQQSGDVTYYADSWSKYVSPEFERTFSFNGTVSNAFGVVASGSEYRFELVFTSGAERLVARGVIPITSEEIREVYPYECFDYDDGDISEHACSSFDYSYTFYYGTGAGFPVPVP